MNIISGLLNKHKKENVVNKDVSNEQGNLIQKNPLHETNQSGGVKKDGIGTLSSEVKNPKDGGFVIPQKKKLRLMPFVVVFVILVIILLLTTIIIYLKKDEKTPGLENNEIVWWGLWNDEIVYKDLIEEYQTGHPQVKIRYVKQNPQDYRERLVGSLSRGQGPDIFRMHNSWVPMLVEYLDRMPESVMGSEEFTKTYYPSIVRDLNILKDFVAVPLEYDALTLFVNEDIFATAGKTPPKTWDEVRDLGISLTTRGGGKILQSGIALGETKNIDYWPEILATLLLQNGVDLGNPGAKSKAAADAFIYFTQFGSKKTAVWNDTLPSSTKAFAQGKVAMYFGLSSSAEGIIKAGPDFRFRTYPVPQARKDDPSLPNVAYASYWVEGVWVNSAKKQVVWDFVKFIMQKESLVRINQNMAKAGRSVQFAYPRIDMASLQIEDPVLGSIIALAPHAKTWYLASNTYDGEKGLNTQINKSYESILDPIRVDSRNAVNIVTGLSQKIPPILSQYQAAIR